MKIGGLSDFNYCWHAVMGGTGEGGAGVRGAAPVGPRGEAPAGGSRNETNELKMFHKQILSRNET